MMPKNQRLGSSIAGAMSRRPMSSGGGDSDAGVHQIVGHNAPPLLHPPLQRAGFGPAEPVRFACSRPGNAIALVSGSSCSRSSTSHHTPSKGSFRVRQWRGGFTLGPLPACLCSSHHRRPGLAGIRSRLSALGVGLISGDTITANADCVSRMVCSNATVSKLARGSVSFVFARLSPFQAA